MMKNYAIVLLVIVLIGCQQEKKEEGFTLKGNIKDLEVSQMYFMHTNADGEQKDTVDVINGTFEIKGKVEEPQIVMLYSEEAKFRHIFYIENTEMTMEGVKDTLDIIGSPVQDDYERMWDQINANRGIAMDYYDKSQAAMTEGDSLKGKEYDSLFNVYYKKEIDIRKQFAADNPESFVSLNVLLTWTNDKTLEEAKMIYATLDTSLLSTKKGKELTAHIENVEKVLIGKPAVNFEQEDVEGKVVKLSDYDGKYVLLEFWASWCGPCRAENPNLRAEYLKYKDKGFNVLAVSLDDDEGRWKQAVEEDDLPWTQVSDLKGFNNQAAVQYGVKAIPANFLIDPDGLIVATDLRGEKLGDKLSEIFN